ncbi:MAG: hypothetical protein FWG50_13605 [Kiritimatiellaeota bacterium]|nr:hypothetical protein [Kiritimatiellota bacterium]
MTMRVLIVPVLAGLLLGGCKKKTESSEAEGAVSGELSVSDLQRQLDEALKK